MNILLSHKTGTFSKVNMGNSNNSVIDMIIIRHSTNRLLTMSSIQKLKRVSDFIVSYVQCAIKLSGTFLRLRSICEFFSFLSFA